MIRPQEISVLITTLLKRFRLLPAVGRRKNLRFSRGARLPGAAEPMEQRTAPGDLTGLTSSLAALPTDALIAPNAQSEVAGSHSDSPVSGLPNSELQNSSQTSSGSFTDSVVWKSAVADDVAAAERIVGEDLRSQLGPEGLASFDDIYSGHTSPALGMPLSLGTSLFPMISASAGDSPATGPGAGDTSPSGSAQSSDARLNDGSLTPTASPSGLPNGSAEQPATGSASPPSGGGYESNPLEVSVTGVTLTEGETGMAAVSSSAIVNSDVTVSYDIVAGTADSTDLVLTSGSTTISSGSGYGFIPVSTLQDTISESDETFTIQLTSVSDGVITGGSATGTIIDDDFGGGGGGGQFSISVSGTSIDEGQSGQAAITASSPVNSDVSVSWELVAGTADSGDLVLGSGTSMIMSGADLAYIPIDTIEDTAPEPNEDFTITLTSVSSGTIGTGTAAGTIIDNDSGSGGETVVSVGDLTVTEGDTGTALLTASQANPYSEIFITYELLAGTADGSDLSLGTWTTLIPQSMTTGTIYVPTVDDLLDEGDETFTIQLTNVAAGQIGSGTSVGTIIDNDSGGGGGANCDDATVMISTTDAEAWEGPYQHIANDIAAFRLERTDASGANAVDVIVNLRLSGTAEIGNDYWLLNASGTPINSGADPDLFEVSLPVTPGQTDVLVQAVWDDDYEGTETVIATVENGVCYVPAEDDSATTNIIDNVADLDIGSAGIPGFLDETEEDDPGANIRLNADFDGGRETPDKDWYGVDGLLASDDDLLELKITDRIQPDNDLSGAATSWYTLMFDSSQIRIWQNDNGTWTTVSSGDQLNVADQSLKVEGIATGTSEILLTYNADDPEGGTVLDPTATFPRQIAQVTDKVKVNVWNADLDIDSDNNNGYGLPPGTVWEEFLEDNKYGIGKMVFWDVNGSLPFTPIRVKLEPGQVDATDQKVKFTHPAAGGDSGHIELWTVPQDVPGGLNPLAVDAGGHKIVAGAEYTVEQLVSSGFNSAVWIQPVSRQESYNTKNGAIEAGDPEDFVSMEFSVKSDDGSWEKVTTDRVKYMVTEPAMFFDNLHVAYKNTTGQVLRDALAAEGVYSDGNEDRPIFGLQNLNGNEMRALNILNDIVKDIEKTQAPTAAGLKIVLYRDYLSPGGKDYVLAFAGTDDAPDALEDLIQGAGVEGYISSIDTQYKNAMVIARGVKDGFNTDGEQNTVRTTGHSLGGGLASAAYVAAGIPAVTFNAAGLHVNTLYVRTIDGDLTPVLTYGQDTLTRYQNPQNVKAFYMKFDLISFFQDNVPPIPIVIPGSGNAVATVPKALGTRIQMTGPFDNILEAYAPQLAAELQNAAPPGTSVYSVWLNLLITLSQNANLANAALAASLIGKMGLHHTTTYYHFGLLVRRIENDQAETWNILGNTDSFYQ